MDIFNFSFWWTDLAGHYEFQTIAVTGIDSLFIAAVLIFVISLALFILVARKIITVRQQT
jgi:hypothetical protein